MINVIDYGGGNIASLCRALERLDKPYKRVEKGSSLNSVDPVILPGVGAFAAVMQALDRRGFIGPLKESINGGTPFLGICVGLQILFDDSEESPGVQGLSRFAGSVQRFKKGKIPQIGWNRIAYSDGETRRTEYGYFVNSYVVRPADESLIWMTSDYHGVFCAGVRHENVTAVQFHPEKSGAWGHEMIRRWADAC